MLVSYAQGRFGNQLFEYAYIQSLRKHHEAVWLLAFDDLYKVFDLKDFNLITKSDSRFWAWFAIKLWRLFIHLRNTKLISSIKENNESHLGDLAERKGFLPFNFIEGYFQNDKCINESFLESFSFKKKIISKADSVLKDFPENKKLCFIHVRHGDYDKEMQLPDSFYMDALKNFDIENTFFYIAGDDPDWSKKFFDFLPNKCVSRNSMTVDFYIMSKCSGGGIISNSTFAYWGAILAQHNAKEKIPVFAPEYWIGWKERKWLPTENIRTERFNYIDCK